MIRRLTIACGLLTLAVVVALALQDHSLFGARSGHRATQVTAIPDKPPVKPAPQPLHHAPAVQAQPAAPPRAAGAPRQAAPAATSSPVQQVIGIVHTILNLPKAIGDDQTQVNPGH